MLFYLPFIFSYEQVYAPQSVIDNSLHPPCKNHKNPYTPNL